MPPAFYAAWGSSWGPEQPRICFLRLLLAAFCSTAWARNETAGELCDDEPASQAASSAVSNPIQVKLIARMQCLSVFAAVQAAGLEQLSIAATAMVSDEVFQSTFLNLALRNTLISEEFRFTTFLPSDDAIAGAPRGLTPRELVPMVYQGTLNGEITTGDIINAILEKRQPNATKDLDALVSTLTFTTNQPQSDIVYMQSPAMKEPSRIVKGNLATCTGYIHIVDRIVETHVPYEDLPVVNLGHETAATENVPLPDVPVEGWWVQQEEDVPPGAASGTEGGAAGSSEGDDGEVMGLPVIIGVIAAAAVAIAVLPCLLLLLIRRDGPVKRWWNGKPEPELVYQSKDIGSFPLMPPNSAHLQAPPSVQGYQGFYLHYSTNSRNASSEIVCPSQPFRQTASGHIVPMTPPPTSLPSHPHPVTIPEVSPGGVLRPSSPVSGGGHVTTMQQRLHHPSADSGGKSSGSKLFVAGAAAWDAAGTTTEGARTNTATENAWRLTPRSQHSMSMHENGGTAQPPWCNSECAGLSAGSQQTHSRALLRPGDITQKSQAKAGAGQSGWWSSQRSGVLGWAASALHVFGLDRSPAANNAGVAHAGAGGAGVNNNNNSSDTAKHGVSNSEVDAYGFETNATETAESRSSRQHDLQMQSRTSQNDACLYDTSTRSQPDGRAGAGLYMTTKPLLRSCPPPQPPLSADRVPDMHGTVHSTLNGQTVSSGKAGGALETTDAADALGSVTNPMYQPSSLSLAPQEKVSAHNLGMPTPQIPAKSENSDYTSSHCAASAGVSNFVSPMPSGLLLAGETSATVTGTDSLQVTGTNPHTLTCKALQLSMTTPPAHTSDTTSPSHHLAGRTNGNRDLFSETLHLSTGPRFGADQSMDPTDAASCAVTASSHQPSAFAQPTPLPGSPVASVTHPSRAASGTMNPPTGPNSNIHSMFHTASTQQDDFSAHGDATPDQMTNSQMTNGAGNVSGGESQFVYATPGMSEISQVSAFNTPRASSVHSEATAADPDSALRQSQVTTPRDLEGGSNAGATGPRMSVGVGGYEGSQLTQATGGSTRIDMSHISNAGGTTRRSGSMSGDPWRDSVSASSSRLGSAVRRAAGQVGKERQPGPQAVSSTSTSRSNSRSKGNPGASHTGGSRMGALFRVRTHDSVPDSVTGTQEPNPPQPGADMGDWKEYLDYQLNSLRGFEFLGGLVMLFGPRTRLHGGQAVVQMCAERQGGKEVAVKFFLSTSAFLDEVKLYRDRDKPLGRFLPEVYRIINCPSEGYTDAHGVPLPPCIVMEKGESLDHWAARGGDGVDSVTGLQVLTHVAERLTDLHACGYVHRDVKPGNVMWLPRKNRWTLIDFGCAARTGGQARKGFSFSYAAPEVIHAVRAGTQHFQVAEGLDVWSIGILAIEMFTGQPVYSMLQPKEVTMAMILGEIEAPWEDPETARVILRRLGHLREIVLAALRRDASRRPSMAEFQKACHNVLNNTSDTHSRSAIPHLQSW